MKLKFDYVKVPIITPFNGTSILRPIILVDLINKNNIFTCRALLDSGSDYNLFPSDVGRKLGIEDIVNNKPMEIRGIGDGKVTVYFHNIEIRVGGWKFPFYCGFTTNPRGLFILGQNNFFDLFKIIFEKQKEAIELEPK